MPDALLNFMKKSSRGSILRDDRIVPRGTFLSSNHLSIIDIFVVPHGTHLNFIVTLLIQEKIPVL